MYSATDLYVPRRSCVRSCRTTSVERFADHPPSPWHLGQFRRALKRICLTVSAGPSDFLLLGTDHKWSYLITYLLMSRAVQLYSELPILCIFFDFRVLARKLPDSKFYTSRILAFPWSCHDEWTETTWNDAEAQRNALLLTVVCKCERDISCLYFRLLLEAVAKASGPKCNL